MKRLSVFLALGILALPLTATAVTVESEDTILASQSTTIGDTYLAGGGTLSLGGKYEDDVIVAGGTVTISGPVKGDVLVGSGTVKITGPVDGSVRVAGGTIEIGGPVGRNVTLAGGALVVSEAAVISGDLVAAGGALEVYGRISGDVEFWGGSALLNSEIKGTVRLHTGDDCGQAPCVTLGPDTNIGGDFAYWAAGEADIQSGATIVGKTLRHDIEYTFDEHLLKRVFTGFQIWMLLASLVVGVVVAGLFPTLVRRVTGVMVERIWAAIGFGTLLLFGLPIGMLLLAFTLVGIQLAVLMAGWYIFLLAISGVFLGAFFGGIVWRSWRKQPLTAELSRGGLVGATVLGMALLSVVFDFLLGASLLRGYPLLTFLGGLVRFALVVWSFGGILLVIWSSIRRPTS